MSYEGAIGQATRKDGILTVLGLLLNHEGHGGMAMERKTGWKEKDFLQLRIDYLKRSEEYKAYCEWKRKLGTDPKCSVPEIFRPQANLKLNLIEVHCQNNFVIYGDIHDPKFSFEQWWKLFSVQKERSDAWIETHTESKDFHGVMDGIELIGKEIEICLAKFKQAHKRDPKPQELKNSFIEAIKATHHIRFYVVVYPFLDKPEIEKEFKEFLKGQMKDPKVKRIRSFRRRP